MLRVPIIRKEYDRVRTGLRKRGYDDDALTILDHVLKYDDQRKQTQNELDELLSIRTQKSKNIGALIGQGKKEEAEALKTEVGVLKKSIEQLENQLRDAKEKLNDALLNIPNVPHELVPAGTKESDNELFKAWDGTMPQLDESALPHWELAKKYNIIDFEIGAKITGSGFPLYRGKGSKLQRALINFFLEEAGKQGYEEIIPPLMVNADSGMATGQLPDKEGQMYHVTADDLYLIPTAEVPITNIYRDTILNADEFPIKVTGYTPCFRREAGSYGAHVKGLNRVHQFDKVEIVRIEHPDHSYQVLDEMLAHVESLLQKLGLPYRILRLCGGDLGFTSAITYDFEVFSAAQKKWLEVSSVSNFETYQSNRMKLRFRNEAGKNQLAHTLNGSALALARIVAALLENYQKSDGIDIPEVLVPYTGFERIE